VYFGREFLKSHVIFGMLFRAFSHNAPKMSMKSDMVGLHRIVSSHVEFGLVRIVVSA